MPTAVSDSVVQSYVAEFKRFPSLSKNGFSFLTDCSNKLFTSTRPTLADVEANIEAGPEI